MAHSILTIWHNPRCSKSRQTLQLIEAADRPVTIRRYLEDSPSSGEIAEILTQMDVSDPRQIMRTGERVYKEMNLSKVTDTAELIAAMALHPILIERPIVSDGTRAIMGRPPESVNKLL
ncbi:arsenate reductase (glutaredoxin) [Litorimonas sp. RW-G-Af-16]|uniref:arsenate reductase (glutaredoxin) n=1 Tax=Litorimonas sp. RW-G-Af-16 TaxID=3241168 RepID=UPI00390C95F6